VLWTDAIEVYRLSEKEFPKSFLAPYFLGEALLKAGDATAGDRGVSAFCRERSADDGCDSAHSAAFRNIPLVGLSKALSGNGEPTSRLLSIHLSIEPGIVRHRGG
jgi:hypothetical protein